MSEYFNEFMHKHGFNNIDEVYRGLGSSIPEIRNSAFEVYRLLLSLT